MKRQRLHLWLCLSLFALLATACTIQPIEPRVEPTKEEKIRELMELSGSADLGSQMMGMVLDQFRQITPEVPDEVWDKLAEKFDGEELVELTIPVYEANFTEEEIDALLVFNRSPIGRSINEKMPVVMQQSMLIGQMWGEKIAQELIEELKREGYDPPQL